MPLKVSSQGWVKVAPPPKERKPRYVDPEEQKEQMRGPLRYLACQTVDPSRERMRILHGRPGFDEVDLLRPYSRLEKSSTLDQWRFDTSAPRSSSRQSGGMSGSGGGSGSGGRNQSRQDDYAHRGGGSWLGNNPNNKDEDILSWTGSIHRHDEDERRSKRHERLSRQDSDHHTAASADPRASKERRRERERVVSAPVIISVSPSIVSGEDKSVVEDAIEEEVFPDNASVAYTETPSERYCRHKHRHHTSRKAPSAIPEEQEEEQSTPAPTPAPAPQLQSQPQVQPQVHAQPQSQPQPQLLPQAQPQLAPTLISLALPRPQPQPEPVPIPTYVPAPAPAPVSVSMAMPTPIPEPTPLPVPVPAPARSESYRSRRSESSYTPSTRSASPIRSEYDPLPTPTIPKSRRAPSEVSPMSSISSRPLKNLHSRPYQNLQVETRTPRDRIATAPPAMPRQSAPSSTSSRSSCSTYSSASGSSVSRSSKSSSTPSMNDYQFQAAIFQPKTGYRGYRAPSLSKGNRWETATSALSFE